jgi:hypothetical protein
MNKILLIVIVALSSGVFGQSDDQISCGNNKISNPSPYHKSYQCMDEWNWCDYAQFQNLGMLTLIE